MSDTSLIIGKLVLWTGFAIVLYAELISKKTFFRCTIFTLPISQREPHLPPKRASFFKSGKSDFFCSKKFAMSLIRAIFAFANGREVATLGFVFTVCLHSAFALPSLWVRSGFASGGEEKHKATRQQKHGTNKRSLTYLLIGNA